MKKVVQIATLAIAATALTGCATILSGKTQSINVTTSNGEQEKVTISGENGSQTVSVPGIVTVNKGGNLTISPESSDCSSQIVAKKVDSTFFVNILSGGAWGSTTDYVSDSMWSYDENITLNCK